MKNPDQKNQNLDNRK